MRVGADSDCLTLHHCLLAAAKPSPLDESHLGPLIDGPGGRRFTAAAAHGAGLSAPEAVALPRSALRRIS